MANISFIENLKKRMAHHWIGGLIGSGLAVVTSLLLFFSAMGDELKRWSYDFPFALRPVTPPPEVILIYMDDYSHQVLGQSYKDPWDRAIHAQMVDRLTAEKARAVVFDIIFDEPGKNAEADAKFAQALQTNGKCILGADYEVIDQLGVETLYMPTPLLRDAAAGWGIVRFRMDGSAIREAFPSTNSMPSLAWKTAQVIGAEVTKKYVEAPTDRWISYYGPPGTIQNLQYHQALEKETTPAGVSFTDKIVFIGAKQSTDFSGAKKDEFETAYTALTRQASPGVEIHATETLNLLRQDWLRRFPKWLEVSCLNALGAVFGFFLTKFRPTRASLIAFAGALATIVIAIAFLHFARFWFAWMIALVQIGVVLFWSMLFNSLRWYIERQVMTDSLTAYLSPGRAQQVLKNPALLQPGGEEQEVTILFSDIAGYSKITGRMDTTDIFMLLNKYYETTLTCVHQTDGTVVQLIGDAIFAVWNAPLRQADHQARACKAALLLRDQLVEFDAAERSLPLRTRIGLHTGPAVVGNLGSKKRFVYAAIGDGTNLASRLEGLNKHVGTQILASRTTQKEVADQIVCRLVGHFRFKGFDKVVEIHELVDPIEKANDSKAWRESFGEALHNFQRKAFDEAERGFRCTIEIRKEDGPSKFYLERLDDLRNATLPYDWAGEVDLKEK